MSAILSGWWQGKCYRVLTKRKKKLVDGKIYRVVELELLHDPIDKSDYTREDFFEWGVGEITNTDRIYVPIGMFNKHFKIDNTLWLLYGKENK